MKSDPRPEELIHAEELINDEKVEEALEIVTNFEKRAKSPQRNNCGCFF